MELVAKGLYRRFGGVRAVDGVDVTLREGETVGLCGSNGAGKTTLFDLLTGFARPDGGHIQLDTGHGWLELTGKPPYRFARAGILRSFQQIRLYGDRTVAENLELARMGCRQRCLREDAEGLLYELGLADVAERPAGELAYGPRRRVEIARAIAGGARLLFLDEPAAGMGREETADLAGQLTACQARRGLGMLLIEHDFDFLASICDRVYCMAEGKILREGPPARVFGDRAVRAALFGE